MPSSTTSVSPSLRTPSATRSISGSSSSIRSAIVSQPSRLATSGVPAGAHSVASGSETRSATRCSRAAARVSAIDGPSAGGSRARSVRSGSLTPRS